jgi:hypothetical protein
VDRRRGGRRIDRAPSSSRPPTSLNRHAAPAGQSGHAPDGQELNGKRSAALLATAVLCLLAAAGPAAASAPAAGAGHGSWSIVAAAHPAGSDDGRPAGVARSSLRSCWAVGSYFDGTHYQTLIEHYAGGRWRDVPSPDAPSSGDNFLDAVSCLPGGPCWAVGDWADPNGLPAHPGGERRRRQVGAAAEPGRGGSASGPDAGRRTDRDSVRLAELLLGRRLPDHPRHRRAGANPRHPAADADRAVRRQLVERRVQPGRELQRERAGRRLLPVVGQLLGGRRYLATSPTGTSTYQTLVEHEDGSGWGIVASPNPAGARTSELGGVSCTGDATCAAVGIQSGNGPNQTLAEADGGSGWTVDPTADSSARRLNALSSVTCPAAGYCWAVGVRDSTGQFLFQTLIEQRTATGWVIVPSPDTSTGQPNVLESVSCPRAGACWAVGYATAGTGERAVNRPLIERYPG